MTTSPMENEISHGSSDEKRRQGIDVKTMRMPEILTNVLQFLDYPTLYSCRTVSRLWNSCSTYVLTQDYVIGCQDIAKALLHEDYELSDKQQWAIDHFQQCSPKIRSLTLGHFGSKHKFFHNSDKLNYTSLRPALFMKNLLSLSVGPIADIRITPESSLLLGEAICSLVRNSPKLEELTYKDFYFTDLTNPSLEQIVENVGPCLRKVILEGPFLFGNLGYLTKLFCDRDQRWQQQQLQDQQSQTPGSPTVPTNSLAATLVPTFDEKGQSSTIPELSWDRTAVHPLEELVIHCMNVSGPNVYPDIDFDSFQAQLPIRSLTLSDFCVPYSSMAGESPLSISSLILGILRRCPALEELNFGTSFLSTYDSFTDGDFSEALTKHVNQMSDFYDTPKLDDDFATELIKACPNLQKLDIGGNEFLTIDHVDELLSNYMHQLASLSVWGIGLIDEESFGLELQPDIFYNLTELDLSGSLEQKHLIYLALKSARNLKRLWALSIPLEASTIVGYDWACTELESLALHIAIPLDPSSSESVPENDNQDTDHCPLVEQYNDPYGIMDEDIYTSSSAEDDKDSKPDADQDNHMCRSYFGPRFRKRFQHQRSSSNTPIQIEVCKQLAKLTHLRELKLEGPSQGGLWDSESEVECMKLTMETGLPYLEPLKRTLEKLDVCQLEEQISGRRETEWIARHFYHHRHPQLHPRLKVFTRTDPIQREAFRDELVDVYKKSPMPSLRELRGISLSGEHGHYSELHMNAEWLQTVCPTLSIQFPTY
ncbi:hypothetical protein BGW38_010880 [Lunasporangiospora selenospora]|uniref:F-box domain-containing protein n=1 Tax=Lunasporangiospora selenospora TaxID=979761 RepID=A0A9P6G1U5_9FUNG|nr:hypothetical protein BGW38_010880 [Lunasporangiospora selenospora]